MLFPDYHPQCPIGPAMRAPAPAPPPPPALRMCLRMFAPAISNTWIVQFRDSPPCVRDRHMHQRARIGIRRVTARRRRCWGFSESGGNEHIIFAHTFLMPLQVFGVCARAFNGYINLCCDCLIAITQSRALFSRVSDRPPAKKKMPRRVSKMCCPSTILDRLEFVIR